MARLIEASGFLLIVAFLWFVWPPLVLLGLGALIVAAANSLIDRPASDKGESP